jgi:hypothetical protein
MKKKVGILSITTSRKEFFVTNWILDVCLHILTGAHFLENAIKKWLSLLG